MGIQQCRMEEDRMRVTERRRRIVELAGSAGRVQAHDLATRFEVNAETIRRDLTYLEESGDLQRIHGGAIPRGALAVEGRVATRSTELREIKDKIAAEAAREIPAFGAIFIEAGSTTARLVGALPLRGDLLVVTNALQTALSVSDLGALNVMTIGGRVRRQSYAEVDAWALERLASLRFDVAFVGTNAVDGSWGLSTPDPAEAAVKRAIISSAQRAVLMVDHTKFGQRAVCRYGALEDVDLVITDIGTDESYLEEMRALGIDVRVTK
jgi:DeoR family fructose operon transcriptional repressor